MKGRICGRTLKMTVILLLMAVPGFNSSAQFKKQAFQQQYNDDKAKQGKDSVDVLFSFKEYFGGLSHANELKIGTMTAGSALVIGGSQIYNRQYWKLPIVYGGIGAGIAGGLISESKGRSDVSKYFFIGAGAMYWASLLDGVISYKPNQYPQAGRATLYSILVPGLGQIYNNEWWKLPIYLGGMGFAFHMYLDNKVNFERFSNIVDEIAVNPDYDGPVTASQAQYYMKLYRRWRDYSLLAIFGVYLLQVIDANVFAYMHNFEVDENLAVKVAPAVILPESHQFAFNPPQTPALGLRMGFSF